MIINKAQKHYFYHWTIANKVITPYICTATNYIYVHRIKIYELQIYNIMERIVPARVKIVRKVSLSETLKALELNRPTRFHVKDFKTQAIRSQVSELRKRKFDFVVDEKNIPDGCIVTRIK